MSHKSSNRALARRWSSLAAGCAALLVATPALAIGKWYVDSKLGDPKPAVAVANPKPVQFLMEFQTDGTINTKAAKFVLPIATKYVDERKVFAPAATAPVADGALLTMTINNVSEKGAAGKGVKVGLTFGLSSTLVTDQYDFTLRYLPMSGAAPVTCEVHHAIHLTLGKKEDATIGIAVKKPQEAIDMVIRQAIGHGMNCIAEKAGFTAADGGAAAKP